MILLLCGLWQLCVAALVCSGCWLLAVSVWTVRRTPTNTPEKIPRAINEGCGLIDDTFQDRMRALEISVLFKTSGESAT